MGVLQPWLLLLAGAAAIPLLLHLLQRQQGKRVAFPAVRYLRRAERESARRIRVRQLLLMLLRMAVVLLVAAAAARPFLRGAGAAHEPAAVVIILDNSLSTGAVSGAGRVLDELRARALETLAAASDADRFWLLRTSALAEPLLAGDALSIAERVRETRPEPTRAQPAAALLRALNILASGSDGRAPEIQLLTDRQASEWSELRAPSGAPSLLVGGPAGEAPENYTVSDVSLSGGIAPIAGTRVPLAARVAGAGTAPVGLRVFLGERLVAAGSAPPGAATVLTLPALSPGIVAGRVEADADALRADDARWFAVNVQAPPAVYAPGATPFLNDALTVMTADGRVRPGTAATADVALLPGAAGIGGLRPSAAAIVLAPASTVELPAVNARLAAAGIPWQLAPTGTAGEAQLAIGDTLDPLLATLATARLTRQFRLVPSGTNVGDVVLLRLRDGTPWLVRGTRPEGGTWLLAGSPLTPDATSIPTSAAMIPLIDRMLGAWSAKTAEVTALEPGATVSVRTGATILRPDGVQDDVTDGTYQVPAVPGVYRVRAGDSIASAFAVNTPAAESELRRLQPDVIERLLPGWRIRTADSKAEWARAMYRARIGAELWRPILLALLGLLVVESIIGAAGARRTAAAPELDTP